jgi:iron complex outermembrane recepter protein
MTIRARSKRCNALLASFVFPAALYWISPAVLAQTPDDDNALEEVRVTARFRDENLQKVPVSVTVFSAQALEDAGIRQYEDFVALTPNVSVVRAESAGQSFLTIRGLTQVRNGEAPVAFVIDGVEQVSNKQFTGELFDLESIQVLKGPQGALYGRNATGGAIVVTTKQPTNEFEGYVKAGAGRGSEYSMQGVVSGPIVPDKLLFRLAGGYVDRDGYFDNVFLDERADGLQDKSVRGLLKWRATDSLSADLRLNLVRTAATALNYQYQLALFDPTNPCFADPANPFGGPVADPNRVVRTFCANNLGQNDRDLDEATVKLDYRLGGGAVLTGIFSYNTIEEYAAGDQFPYTASRNVFGVVDGTQTQFTDIAARSAEVRLASSEDRPLRWLLGGYSLTTDRFISTTTGRDLGLGIARIEHDPQFVSTLNPTLSWLADDNDNEAWALFGNAAYDLTKALELSLALRYDSDERNQSVDPRSTSGVPAGCTLAARAGCVRSETFDRLQPKVSMRYELSSDAQVYASWGRGFRSGEFNQFGTGAAAATVGLTGVADLVGAETSESVEVGFKSELFDRRLRLNAAVFDTTVKGQQYFAFVGAIGAQILLSIDEVKIRGGELEAIASLAKGLDVYAGVGISESEIERYSLNSADAGNWAPYVPKASYNVGAQYRFPLAGSMALLTRADFISKGKQYWDPENSAPRDTVNLLNLRVGLEDAQGKWALTAMLANATDTKYNAEFVLGGFTQPATPRVWTADFRYNF